MSKCKATCEVYSRVCGYFRPVSNWNKGRVCGYFRPVSNWNKGKKEEFKERKTYKVQ